MKLIFLEADPRLVERFERYHANNPHVYEQFKLKASQMKRRRSRYSAWTIITAIRWDHDLTTNGDEFKINNDFIALYARLLIYEDPSYDGFFMLRVMKPFGRKLSGEEHGRAMGGKGY